MPSKSLVLPLLPAVLAASLFSASTQAQVVVIDWNTPGQGYTFGSWSGNVVDVGGARQIVAPSTGDGGTGTPFSTDVSSLTAPRFAITARPDAGNQLGLEIVLTPSAPAANPNWIYFYQVDLSLFTSGVFTTATSPLLTEPSFVLDSANGFSFVGAGAAFAPDLSQIGGIHVQGAGFQSAQDFRFTFDTLQIVPVPEPSSMLAVGVGLAVLGLVRRYRK